MEVSSISALFGAIFLLVAVSAYFSGSETAMMALNRYRLKHLKKQGHGGAKRADLLLQRPDRLLGVILIGNNLANFTAASLATILAIEVLGDRGIAAAPIICTVIFLIFAEVAPKTIAAVYPEKVALPSSYILQALLWISFPFVWVVNSIANGLLNLFGVKQTATSDDELSIEELRTVVHEGSKIGGRDQDMMLGILDLGRVTVDDIMVPRAEIIGINIEDKMTNIMAQLRSTQHTMLPIFKDDLEKIIGVLHIRNATKFIINGELTKDALMRQIRKPYFVLEGTALQTQLINFQSEKERIGMIVDEYGHIQGIVTIEDILEEIVGEFTSNLPSTREEIRKLSESNFLIEGGAQIRTINRVLEWELPIDGPKTLNGLITEHLENIPEANVCLKIEDYRIEILLIRDNVIKKAKLSKMESEGPSAETT
ncbi:MAG: magnesium/cobalt efflux protein [Gammaproteobacteria bacterium]|nr:magnesium/cobalt efflux protein [Gammaproteobacteria bacterium]